MKFRNHLSSTNFYLRSTLYSSLLTLLAFTACEVEEPIPTYTLTTTISPTEGGKITVSPQATSYPEGSQVTLTPEANENWVFKQWEGDAIGNTTPLQLTMTTNKAITGVFIKRDYPLNIKIEGEGTVEEKIVPNPSGREYPHGTTVELTPKPKEGWEFDAWSGDLTGNEVPKRITVDKQKNVTVNFIKVEKLKIKNGIDTLIISKKHKFSVFAIYSNGKEVDVSDKITIEKQSKITIGTDKSIVGAEKGLVKTDIQYFDKVITAEFYVHNIEFETIDANLKSDGNCSIIVPVIMINMFPTKDGIIHNDSVGPYSYWEIINPPLEKSKLKVKQDLVITKEAVEQGTRYMDRGENKLEKYACINTVAYINVYNYHQDFFKKISNRIPYDPRVNTFDYKKLFKELNIEFYVNQKGVKEIWISYYPFSTYPSTEKAGIDDFSKHTYMPESNMSSPLTGDISNSFRELDDLPIYDKTYVVYGNSGHRGVDTNLHNRGHQIETQLRHIEKDKKPNHELFWNHFVGVSNNSQALNGRVGNTHFPPNGKSDYDYNNNIKILTDIDEWRPMGGVYKEKNNENWLKVNYGINMKVNALNYYPDYNNDPQSKWLIYWFQSIPGKNNNIPYTTNQGRQTALTNWWDLFFNWDNAISNNKTLWVE